MIVVKGLFNESSAGKKKKINESMRIKNRFPPEIAVLEFVKNSKAEIRESNLLYLGKFLDENLEDGVSITANLMTPHGSNDIGEVDHFTGKVITIKQYNQGSYDFPLSQIIKIYLINFNSASGYLLMGKTISLYLRNY